MCVDFAVEKIQAMFTVLKAFGSVTTPHHRHSTRFSMVMSLDFNATGRITAAHLQVTLHIWAMAPGCGGQGEEGGSDLPQVTWHQRSDWSTGRCFVAVCEPRRRQRCLRTSQNTLNRAVRSKARRK